MKIELSKDVKRILNKLENAGFESYIVGGCVRDCLRGKVPKDWDIVTSAKDFEIMSVFEKTFYVGEAHGTIIVPLNGVNYEVSSFKEFIQQKVSSISTDLSMRDFTINAMAYNEQSGLIDLFGGEKDIANGIIRAVGSPLERFTEDPLRMLRAIRFVASLGFEIENNTIESIKNNAELISKVSVERIREELTKILLSNPFKIRILHEVGILKIILPEFDDCFGVEQNHPHHIFDVAQHSLYSVDSIIRLEKSATLAWIMFLHDIGKPCKKSKGKDGHDHFYGHGQKSAALAENILKRLKFDNNSIDTILKLIRFHDTTINLTKISVKRYLARFGMELFCKLILVKRTDSMAQNLQFANKKFEELDKICEILQMIKDEDACFSIKQLDIRGEDLLDAGVMPGKKVGEILKTLLEKVICDPELNKKDKLLQIVREICFGKEIVWKKNIAKK